MIILQVKGMDYSNWTSVTVTKSLDAASGSFNFVSVTDESNPIPIRPGDSVVVLVNSVPVITGFVDSVEIGYSSTDHSIQIAGRDKTADLIDSKVDYELEFTAPITLQEISEKAISNVGASISVVDQVGSLSPFEKGDLLSASIGQTAFSFIEEYARKRQVTVTSNGAGNLVFARSDNAQSAGSLLNVIGGQNNNIKSASILYDDSERFSNYKIYSQGNPGGDPYADESSEQLTDRTANYTDDGVRSSRKYNNLAESSGKEATLADRAKWEGEIRKAKSFSYSCTVAGFSPKGESGAPFELNTLLQVKDDFGEVDRELLVSELKFTQSVGAGSQTDLTLIPKEAFSLQKSTDSFQPKTSKKTPKQVADEQRTIRDQEQLWTNKRTDV